jgi:hypothetical protein
MIRDIQTWEKKIIWQPARTWAGNANYVIDPDEYSMCACLAKE